MLSKLIMTIKLSVFIVKNRYTLIFCYTLLTLLRSGLPEKVCSRARLRVKGDVMCIN